MQSINIAKSEYTDVNSNFDQAEVTGEKSGLVSDNYEYVVMERAYQTLVCVYQSPRKLPATLTFGSQGTYLVL